MKKTFVLLAGVLFAFLVASCDSSSQKSANENGNTALQESVSSDSTEKAEDAPSEGNEDAKEASEIYSQLTLQSLIEMFGNPSLAEKYGFSFIYEDSMEDEVETTEVVYGKWIKKGEKEESGFGYKLENTSNHSCYFFFYSATSEGASLNFANKEDAESVFDRMTKSDSFEFNGMRLDPSRNKDSGSIELTSVEEEGFIQNRYSINPVEFSDGYYQIVIWPYM